MTKTDSFLTIRKSPWKTEVKHNKNIEYSARPENFPLAKIYNMVIIYNFDSFLKDSFVAIINPQN